MNQQQLDHLHAKFGSGTGHADTTRYEFITAHHRDILSSFVASNALISYLSTADSSSSTERIRQKYLEEMVRPCGPPPPLKE